MPEFFETITKSYADVPIDANNGVDVNAFLEATENLIRLFDHINATAFSPVKSDMNGNVTKIRNRFLQNPIGNQTLQALVLGERQAGEGTATVGLLWLKRGLEFTAAALRRNLNDSKEELSTSFQKAYESTLKPFHGFLVRPVFSLAMKACPYRKDFYLKLGSNVELVQEKMQEWLKALEHILAILIKFYKDEKLE